MANLAVGCYKSVQFFYTSTLYEDHFNTPRPFLIIFSKLAGATLEIQIDQCQQFYRRAHFKILRIADRPSIYNILFIMIIIVRMLGKINEVQANINAWVQIVNAWSGR